MLKHKSLVMVSILVLVLAVVAMSCAPAKPATPPTPPAPPVVAPPVTPPVVTPPVVTPPAATTPPVAPAIVEKVTSYSATAKKFSNDKVSISYPDTFVDTASKIPGVVFYGKGPGKDNVFVAIRSATVFKDAASTFLADLIAASGAAFSPSIDNETTVTLADGTKANVILLSAAFGMAKAAITGVIKDGNAIMVVGASDPKSMALYQEIGSTLIVK